MISTHTIFRFYMKEYLQLALGLVICEHTTLINSAVPINRCADSRSKIIN